MQRPHRCSCGRRCALRAGDLRGLQLEVRSPNLDATVLNKCNIQTRLKDVIGQFTLETADGYITQDVPFDELELLEDHDHDDPQTHVDTEYVLTHRVTTTGWYLLQVRAVGVRRACRFARGL
jgi:hypothetical protein